MPDGTENTQKPATYYRWSEIALEPLNPKLDRHFVVGETMMLARVLLKKGCIVPMHQHENEQITYILEGALHFKVGGGEVTVHAGESEGGLGEIVGSKENRLRRYRLLLPSRRGKLKHGA